MSPLTYHALCVLRDPPLRWAAASSARPQAAGFQPAWAGPVRVRQVWCLHHLGQVKQGRWLSRSHSILLAAEKTRGDGRALFRELGCGLLRSPPLQGQAWPGRGPALLRITHARATPPARPPAPADERRPAARRAGRRKKRLFSTKDDEVRLKRLSECIPHIAQSHAHVSRATHGGATFWSNYATVEDSLRYG
jgi:hypothetical protein